MYLCIYILEPNTYSITVSQTHTHTYTRVLIHTVSHTHSRTHTRIYFCTVLSVHTKCYFGARDLLLFGNFLLDELTHRWNLTHWEMSLSRNHTFWNVRWVEPILIGFDMKPSVKWVKPGPRPFSCNAGTQARFLFANWLSARFLPQPFLIVSFASMGLVCRSNTSSEYTSLIPASA